MQIEPRISSDPVLYAGMLVGANLKPYPIKTFKVSRDKHFVEKLYDVADFLIKKEIDKRIGY